MSLGDVSLALDAFARWSHPLPADLLSQITTLSLDRLREESQGEEGTSVTPSVIPGEGVTGLVLVQLLGGLMAAGAAPPREWLSAWSGLMDAEAVRQLGGDPVLQLVKLLAHERMEGLRPSAK